MATFDLAKFKMLAEFITPLILSSLGHPELAKTVGNAIQTAEAVFDGIPDSGAQKKELALQAIEETISVVNEVKPGTVNNPDELLSIASDGIDLTVRAINAGQHISTPPVGGAAQNHGASLLGSSASESAQ